MLPNSVFEKPLPSRADWAIALAAGAIAVGVSQTRGAELISEQLNAPNHPIARLWLNHRADAVATFASHAGYTLLALAALPRVVENVSIVREALTPSSSA